MSKRVGCSSCGGGGGYNGGGSGCGGPKCACCRTIYIPPCSDCPCTDYLTPFYPWAYDSLESVTVPVGYWGQNGGYHGHGHNHGNNYPLANAAASNLVDNYSANNDMGDNYQMTNAAASNMANNAMASQVGGRRRMGGCSSCKKK